MRKERIESNARTPYIPYNPLIARHIVPLLGSRRVKDLNRADVAKFIREVTATSGAGAATRTVNFLSAILTFAVHEDIIEYNPAHHVPRQPYGRRDRRLSPDEYRALGRALREEGEIWQTIIGVKLLALTGCRIGEVINLKWSEIDAAEHCLRLAWTKEGASVRPIGQAALDLLGTLVPHPGSPFILYGVRDPSRLFGGLQKGLRRLMARAGLIGVSAHSFRHSYASVAASFGLADSTIGAMLGHAGSSVTS